MWDRGRPNLFIVGHPKTGTTALHAFLGEHPEISMSRPKEPWYFCSDFHQESDRHHGRQLFFRFRTESRYRRAFTHARDERVIGEASAIYLHSRSAAENIARFQPASKIIVMLREPVSFLRALHKEFVRNAMEDEPDFAVALEKEEDRRKGRHLPPGVPCPSWVLYSDWIDFPRQVGEVHHRFGSDRVLVVLSEDFRSDNQGIYRKVLEFLEVDASFVPEFRSLNDRGPVELSRFGRMVFNPRLRWIAQNALPYPLYRLGIRLARRSAWRDTVREDDLASPGIAGLCDRFAPQVREAGQAIGIDLASKWGYPPLRVPAVRRDLGR